MDRSNHYEAAFEAYLQWHRLCYVAVDETRRAVLGESRVKSLDFIVYGHEGARLLVDVKGRRYPAGPAERPRRVWECWSTLDDLDGLSRWTELFGTGYQGLLVFAYHLQPAVALPVETEDLWTWRGRCYLFRAIAAGEYSRHARTRSPKWRTVHLPGAVFRQLVQPLHQFTHRAPVASEECPF
jgi:hypothetical protein